jgi:multidrug resistance efflux pump
VPRVDDALEHGVFRPQAWSAYQRGTEDISALRSVSPSMWAILLCVGSLVLTALGVTLFGSVELTGDGRGVLEGPVRAQAVVAQVSGMVVQTYAQSGQLLALGDQIATLEPTALRAELQAAEHRLSIAEDRLRRAMTVDDATQAQRIRLLAEQRQLTRQRLRSQRQTLAGLQDKRSAFRKLTEKGFLSEAVEQDTHEEARAVQRSILDTRQEVAQAEIQMRMADLERETQLASYRAEKEKALSERDAARLLLDQAIITAPQHGRLEAFTLTAGHFVQAGTQVARLVPLGKPTVATAFVRESDRAFLAIGSEARLEIDRLPTAEFGSVRAVVRRIANDLATSTDVQTLLGEAAELREPRYLVELELGTDPRSRALLDRLDAGSLVTVRFVLRERRILTLLFEPLQRFVQ